MKLPDQYERLRLVLEEFSKKCPNCQSTKLTTKNNAWPLLHKCLSCNANVKESKNGEMTYVVDRTD